MQLLFSDQNFFLPLNFNRFKNSAAIIDIYSQRILMESGLLSRLHALMNKKCLWALLLTAMKIQNAVQTLYWDFFFWFWKTSKMQYNSYWAFKFWKTTKLVFKVMSFVRPWRHYISNIAYSTNTYQSPIWSLSGSIKISCCLE